jgi:hypothetical protein
MNIRPAGQLAHLLDRGFAALLLHAECRALERKTDPTPTPVAESFNAEVVKEAIREAQALLDLIA